MRGGEAAAGAAGGGDKLAEGSLSGTEDSEIRLAGEVGWLAACSGRGWGRGGSLVVRSLTGSPAISPSDPAEPCAPWNMVRSSCLVYESPSWRGLTFWALKNFIQQADASQRLVTPVRGVFGTVCGACCAPKDAIKCLEAITAAGNAEKGDGRRGAGGGAPRKKALWSLDRPLRTSFRQI